MSGTASVEMSTILDNNTEHPAVNYGSSLAGIPMPEVEEISLDGGNLGEFGEVCLKELETPEETEAIDPLDYKAQNAHRAQVLRPITLASASELTLQPLEPINRTRFHTVHSETAVAAPATRETPRATTLSPEQANFLSFQAISDCFAPVQSDLSVIPEVADCIRWLKHPLYNTTTGDGRLFINANHPYLKQVTALIDLGHYTHSVREPAYDQLIALTREAAKIKARDFQKCITHTEQVKKAVAGAIAPRYRVINWLHRQGETLIPAKHPEHKPMAFSRDMLRYELAVHRLLRAVWPLVLKKLEQQQDRASESWRSAFFAYGNILRSTQVISEPITK